MTLKEVLEIAIKRITELEAEIKEFQTLFEMQKTRLKQVTKLWQEATGQHGTIPDLGDLVEWLLELVKKAESERDLLFPIQDGPSIPWYIMRPHEVWCRKNHHQTLERIAQRGGLGAIEAICVVRGWEFREAFNKHGGKQLRQWWYEFAESVNNQSIKVEAEVKRSQEDMKEMISMDDCQSRIAKARVETERQIARGKHLIVLHAKEKALRVCRK